MDQITLRNRLLVATSMWREATGDPLPKLAPGDPADQIQSFELKLVDRLWEERDARQRARGGRSHLGPRPRPRGHGPGQAARGRVPPGAGADDAPGRLAAPGRVHAPPAPLHARAGQRRARLGRAADRLDSPLAGQHRRARRSCAHGNQRARSADGRLVSGQGGCGGAGRAEPGSERARRRRRCRARRRSAGWSTSRRFATARRSTCCWLVDEDEIRFWHAPDAGFAGSPAAVVHQSGDARGDRLGVRERVARQAGGGVGIDLVERLAIEQRGDQRVEVGPMLDATARRRRRARSRRCA